MSDNCNHEFITTWEETYQYEAQELNGYIDKFEVYRADVTCSNCGIQQSRFGKSYIEDGE
jgi:hypothetical protein